MAHDLGLLLDPVALQRPARPQGIVIAAPRVAAQHQIPAAERLRLPHVDHFVDEMGLALERSGGEIVAIMGRVWVEVGHGAEMDFFYSVRPQPYEAPTFALQDPRRPASEGTRHYRAEVYLREGGQDYDVMGWPKVQVIHDVLDQYERHRQFLDHVR